MCKTNVGFLHSSERACKPTHLNCHFNARLHTCTQTHARLHTCMQTHITMHTLTRTHMHMCTCAMRTHIRTHTHTHTHNTHTHIHRHTQAYTRTHAQSYTYRHMHTHIQVTNQGSAARLAAYHNSPGLHVYPDPLSVSVEEVGPRTEHTGAHFNGNFLMKMCGLGQSTLE